MATRHRVATGPCALLLLFAVLTARSSRAGDGDPRVLPMRFADWLERAQKSGDPLDLRELVGPTLHARQNGAVLVAKAQSLLPSSRWRDFPPACYCASDAATLAQIAAWINDGAAYYEALGGVATCPGFEPELGVPSSAGPKPQAGIIAAIRAQSLRAALGPQGAWGGLDWILSVLSKWRVRTHIEGLHWDSALEEATRIVRCLCADASVRLPTEVLERLRLRLKRAEDVFAVSIRPRVLSERAALIQTVRTALLGSASALEDPVLVAAVRRLEYAPAARSPYAGRPDLLAEEAVVALEAFGVAIAAAGDTDAMRATLQQSPDSPAPRPGSAFVGGFDRLLQSMATIRLARLGLELIALRGRGGVPEAPELQELAADPQFEDPASGEPFQISLAPSRVVVRRALAQGRADAAGAGVLSPLLLRW